MLIIRHLNFHFYNHSDLYLEKVNGFLLIPSFFAELLEVGVDRLPEERARRVLERVDLLNRLRNDVLPHPALKDALELALPSKDMPDWWIPGKHDHDLLKGVSR